jgi:hypothetical protein
MTIRIQYFLSNSSTSKFSPSSRGAVEHNERGDPVQLAPIHSYFFFATVGDISVLTENQHCTFLCTSTRNWTKKMSVSLATFDLSFRRTNGTALPIRKCRPRVKEFYTRKERSHSRLDCSGTSSQWSLFCRTICVHPVEYESLPLKQVESPVNTEWHGELSSRSTKRTSVILPKTPTKTNDPWRLSVSPNHLGLPPSI